MSLPQVIIPRPMGRVPSLLVLGVGATSVLSLLCRSLEHSARFSCRAERSKPPARKPRPPAWETEVASCGRERFSIGADIKGGFLVWGGKRGGIFDD